ncbi:MAG: hypothetical protein KDC78_11445 [Aequorivita sp.]|nr:hypothetical protein [Aequorivita sp.]
MKTSITVILFCCFIHPALVAQDSYKIKNRWKQTFLNTNASIPSATINNDWETAIWQLIDVGNGEFQIKNQGDGTYLNMQSNRLSSTEIGADWSSAKWQITPVQGTQFVRINNVLKSDCFLNVEKGLACTPIQDGWWSAMWALENVNKQTSTVNETSNPMQSNDSANELFNIQRILESHNKLRREVGVAPLTWSDELAKTAQKWADKLALKNQGESWELKHSHTQGLGENIAGGFVNGDPPEKRILNWGKDEKANYNPATGKCYDGKKCGHYTQVVWRNTTEVGCAIAVNPNGKYILVCNYSPPGNYSGQRPY